MAYIFGSIWDRFNRNALNALSKSVEQQGKSIQDLVAKGQLTPTQYATLIQAVNGLISKGEVSPLDINKNLGKFDGTYFSSDFLEELNKGAINTTNVLPKSITNIELDSKSVTSENTTFFSAERINLANPANFGDPNTSVDPTNGQIKTTNRYINSGFIPVVAGRKYAFSQRYQLAWYDVNKNYISGSAELFTQPLTAPPGARYLRTTFLIDNGNKMVIEGDFISQEIPYYSPENEIISISNEHLKDEIKGIVSQKINDDGFEFDDNSIKLEKLEPFIVRRINIANPADFGLENTAIRYTDGEVIPYDGFIPSGFIPVSAGAKYMFSQRNNTAWYDKDYKFISGVASVFTQPLTAPAGAKYLRTTFTMTNSDRMVVEGSTLPSQTLNYNDPGSITVNFKNAAWGSALQKSLSGGTRLQGLKWNIMGDSISDPSYYRATEYYFDYIANRTSIIPNSYGIANSTVTNVSDPTRNPMVNRYSQMSNTADVVTILGGTNDVISQAPLGTFGDTDVNTFYGALDTMIKGILTKYPEASVGYILPPFPKNGSDYTREYTIDYMNAIKEVCQRYTVPVLDLYTQNQLSGIVPERSNILIPDGLHPSNKGHEKMSFAIEQFLLSIV